MRTIMIGLGALLLTAAAQAQEMPRYDVEGYCKAVAGIGGSFSNTMYNSCIDMEQQAYSGIKPSWGAVPVETQGYCDDVASVGGPGSYTMLESCVQMETSAAEQTKQFSFD